MIDYPVSYGILLGMQIATVIVLAVQSYLLNKVAGAIKGLSDAIIDMLKR